MINRLFYNFIFLETIHFTIFKLSIKISIELNKNFEISFKILIFFIFYVE